MHRPRHRGARPLLLALLAALLLAARGTAAQGKRHSSRLVGLPGPGHPPAYLWARRKRSRPRQGSCQRNSRRREAGEDSPWSPTAGQGAPRDLFLGVQPQLSVQTGSMEELGVVGVMGCFLSPNLSLEP